MAASPTPDVCVLTDATSTTVICNMETAEGRHAAGAIMASLAAPRFPPNEHTIAAEAKRRARRDELFNATDRQAVAARHRAEDEAEMRAGLASVAAQLAAARAGSPVDRLTALADAQDATVAALKARAA